MEKTKKYSGVFWLTFFIMSIMGAVISGKISEINYIDLLKPYFILFLVLGAVVTLVNDKYPGLMEDKRSVLILCAGYGLSMAAISFFPFLPADTLWMAGSILIARLVHPYIGLIFQLIFTYLFCTLSGYSLEFFVCYLLIGAVMCLLVKYMTKWSTFFYVAIISLSIHVIIILLLNNFDMNSAISLNNLYAILCDGLMLLAIYLLPDKQRKALPVKEEEDKEEGVLENVLKEEKHSPEKEMVDYEQYISTDAVLMKRLKESFPMVYRHSLLISMLSEKAARYINCNASLAKAGGMYHEIGKISVSNLSEGENSEGNLSKGENSVGNLSKGENSVGNLSQGDYIKQGILLAKEHNLAEEIIDIIREHNGKNGAPKSKESVIVMLTDNIIATIKYFEKETEKKYRIMIKSLKIFLKSD